MDDILINEKRMSEVLESARAELAELPADTVVRANVQRTRAVALTRTLVSNFPQVEVLLDDELSPARAAQRRAQWLRLTDRALAFFAADLARETGGRARKDRFTELVELVARHDTYLLGWAWPLFGGDEKLADVLGDIRAGTGHQDSTEDVIRLVAMYRERWDQAEGKTPVTREYLAQAEADATEMVGLLDSAAGDGRRDLARRAYTAWRNDYHDLVSLARYLLQGSSDLEARFPGIATASRGASRGSDEVSEPVTEPVPEPAEPAVVIAGPAEAAAEAL